MNKLYSISIPEYYDRDFVKALSFGVSNESYIEHNYVFDQFETLYACIRKRFHDIFIIDGKLAIVYVVRKVIYLKEDKRFPVYHYVTKILLTSSIEFEKNLQLIFKNNYIAKICFLSKRFDNYSKDLILSSSAFVYM